MKGRVGAVALGVLLAAGCSSGGKGGGSHGSGSGSLTGTFGGSAMTVRSAITAKVSLGGGNTIQAIVLADASNACATVSAGQQPANTQIVLLQLGNTSGQTIAAPTAPGTFDFYSPVTGPTGSAVGAFSYQKSDGTCTVTATAASTSGSITITSVAGGDFVGSTTAVTDAGDSISASFTAASCPALGPLLTQSSPPPCKM